MQRVGLNVCLEFLEIVEGDPVRRRSHHAPQGVRRFMSRGNGIISRTCGRPVIHATSPVPSLTTTKPTFP